LGAIFSSITIKGRLFKLVSLSLLQITNHSYSSS